MSRLRNGKPRAGRALAAGVAFGLAWVSIRRLLLLGAALSPARRFPAATSAELPSVTLAIPAHNEEDLVDGLVSSLEQLDYPPEKLKIVFICDGSTDATLERLCMWAVDRPRVRVVELPRRVGKAAALNEALALASGELLVVLDADLRPRRNFLTQLVSAFTDPSVGAAGGLLNPANASETLISRYCAIDSWVNQLIVGTGKDRLGLNPPTFGASAYRSDALTAIGGFWAMNSGEDVEASLALERAGWRTRFLPEAVADNTVAATVGDYWRQHLRWARGNLAARNPRRLPPGRRLVDRLEAWNVAAGYLDRVLLLAALPFVATGLLPRRVVAAYLVIPGAEVVASVVKAGSRQGLAGFALATIAVFPLDLAASAAAVLLHLGERPQEWRSPRIRRAGLPSGEEALS